MLWTAIKRIFGGVWRVLSGISKGISVLLPILLVAYLVGALLLGFKAAQPEPMPDRAALLVNLSGVLVENRTPLEPFDALMQGDSGEVLLPVLLKAINDAADDDRVTALVMDLQALAGPSVTQTLEIKAALDTFKASGKPVVAIGDYYDQGQYALAAQADTVVLHPEGGINLYGFAIYKSYVKQLLENAKITMNVFRVGENKSAVEPFLRDDMSESEREVIGRWLGDLWDSYTGLVEQSRGFEPGAVQQFINEFPDRLEVAGGDQPQLMLDAGFVDKLFTHDQRDQFLSDLVGATDEDGHYQAIEYGAYAQLNADNESESESKSKSDGGAVSDAVTPLIAIVPIEGELIPGESMQGFAGSDTVVDQLERAVELEGLAAVVLRINSPGGSVFASEVMRQKILAIKDLGLPVVVSMGGVAASGGYYIAADADQIWAHPSTITGSIGVFAAFPTVEKLYDWAGATVDGVSTTGIASAIRFDTGVNPAGRRIINSLISNIYVEFVDLVARGRGLSWDQVNDVAGGLVWSGRDALDIGLVDSLGGLDAAVAAAATLADVSDYEIRRVGTPLSPEQLILEQIGKELGSVHVPGGSMATRLIKQLVQPLRIMDSLQDPKNIYVRCLECASAL